MATKSQKPLTSALENQNKTANLVVSTLFKRLAKVQTEGDATTLSGSEFHFVDYTMTICTSNIHVCSITRWFTQCLGMTTSTYAKLNILLLYIK